MSRSNSLRVLLLLCICITSCQRRAVQTDEAPDIGLLLEIVPSPATVGEATLMLHVTDIEKKPLRGLSLNVKGDMTHPGMAPVMSQSEEIEPGLYRVPFNWTMGGDWVLSITCDLPDGRRFQRTIEVPVFGAEAP